MILLLLACGAEQPVDTGSKVPPGETAVQDSDTDPPDTQEIDTAPADADGDGVHAESDCDDGDAAVGGPSPWFGDADDDGAGNAALAIEACLAPPNFVADATDCDDTRADVHPGAAETCDGADQDCDGAVDEDAVDPSTWYADTDGDGFGDPGVATTACTGDAAEASDCDDTRADRHPGAAETCDGVDQDCDGVVDEDPVDPSTWYADTDGDGFGDPGLPTSGCTGDTVDASDCDDLRADVHPSAVETCDGVDQDCDLEVDNDAIDASTWYADADGDGFGDPASGATACAGATLDATDCDDGDATTIACPCASTCDCATGELCYTDHCALASEDLDIYLARVDAVVAAMNADGSFSTESAYPTEALMTLASAAAITCDADYADAAAARAAYARTWENADHLLEWTSVPFLSRDYIARHVYNLWATAYALDDSTWLDAADEVATAFMALDRQPHGDFELFCTTFYTSAPYACKSEPWIDVNQNAEVGMAFSVLAADPNSVLFEDPTAIAIADEELAAACSIQAADGAIPIGESYGYEDDYDTLYGSYAAMTLAIASRARPDDLALAGHVLLAASWLGPLSDADPVSSRFYPHPYEGEISLSEGAMRLTVLGSAGTVDPAFVDAWWAIVDANTETYSTFLPGELMAFGGLPLETWLRPADEGG